MYFEEEIKMSREERVAKLRKDSELPKVQNDPAVTRVAEGFVPADESSSEATKDLAGNKETKQKEDEHHFEVPTGEIIEYVTLGPEIMGTAIGRATIDVDGQIIVIVGEELANVKDQGEFEKALLEDSQITRQFKNGLLLSWDGKILKKAKFENK